MENKRGILKGHIKTKIRVSFDDIEVYNPNEEQISEIKTILKKEVNIDTELNMTGTLDSRVVRFLIRELTSIGSEIDELSDEELNHALTNGDIVLKKTINELKEIINEILYDIQRETYESLTKFNSVLDVIEFAQKNVDSQDKMQKILAKMGLSMTVEEYLKLSKENPDELAKIINDSKPKTRKRRTK